MRTKLTDTWFVYSATFVPIERLELAVSGRHEIVHEAPLSSAAFTTRSDLDRALGHLKYTIMPPRPGHLALAIGAQDITGATNELGDGRDDRGRRLFLVGTYDWATLGITHMHGKIGEYAGVRLTATNGIDLICEAVFPPAFAGNISGSSATANVNLGIRFYPREINGLHVDLTGIGDGQFQPGFAAGWTFR